MVGDDAGSPVDVCAGVTDDAGFPVEVETAVDATAVAVAVAMGGNGVKVFEGVAVYVAVGIAV